MIAAEEQLRRQHNIPDNATLLDKNKQRASIGRSADGRGLAHIGFIMPSGMKRHICRVAGNHIYFEDDNDGKKAKFIDTRWIRKDGILRPAATRHHITITPTGVVSYELKGKSIHLDFGKPFEIDGHYARADLGNGLTAKLWCKAGKFEKQISGVGHPNLPTTTDGKYYIWSVKMSGLPVKSAFLNEHNAGTFKIRRARIWNDIPTSISERRVPVKQRFTADAWEKLLPVSFFQDGVAWTTDGTIYYSGAGDGWTENDPNSTWDTTHDGAGVFNDDTGTSMNCTTAKDGSAKYYFDHLFAPVDTSGIDDGALLASVALNLYVTSKNDGDDDAQGYITVVQTTQASTSSLENTDHVLCGAVDNPTEAVDAGGRADVSGISTSAYLTFPFNATGIGWVNDTGFTKIGCRQGHDAEDVTYAGANGSQSTIAASTSEETGTSQDPYLDVSEGVAQGGLILSQMRRRSF